MGRVHITYETVAESGLHKCKVLDEFERFMLRYLSQPAGAPEDVAGLDQWKLDVLQKWCGQHQKSYPAGLRKHLSLDFMSGREWC